MHVTTLVALTLFVFQAKDVVVPIPTNGTAIDTIITIIPPVISQQAYTKPVKTSEEKKVPITAIPVPVPDEDAPTEVDIPDQQQLSLLAPDTPIENLGTGTLANIDSIVKAIIPPPDAPSFYDEPPMMASQVLPKYPALAERAGIEGWIWIQSFIDKDGNVLDVRIMSVSPANVGFEEAALEAARQSVWRPAISNGLPIGVWITYKVEFKLK